MKNFIVVMLCLFCIEYTFGQTILIQDKSTLKPIELVSVYNKQQKESYISSNKGEIKLEKVNGNDTLYFSLIGYKPEVFTVNQLEKKGNKVFMTEDPFVLNEFVVSASKFEEKITDVPQQIQVIKSRDIAFANVQTSGDLIQNTGNVMVQKSQYGAGSPIIRGFETNKVLLVIDGVRMNNAIYRGGHLQNIMTLDNTIMDKVEVVFGPGSVVYGSDALGGVMHFITKNPELASSGNKLVSGNAFTRFSSASNEKTAHIDINIANSKIGSLTSFTFSDFGDLTMGANKNPFYNNYSDRQFYVKTIDGKDSVFSNQRPNVQVGSGYSQYDLLQKVFIKHSERVSSIFNFQYSTSSDVPRYDRLFQVSKNNPRFAEWYYGPQKRVLGSYTLNLKSDSKLFSNAKIIGSYQNIVESRHDRRFKSQTLNNRIETLNIFGLNADFQKIIHEHEIRYGFEGVYNDINSTAYSTNISTGERKNISTRYPDGGSIYRSLAAYITHTYEINEKIVLTDGLRFSNVNLYSLFNDKTFFPFPFSDVRQNNNAVNGNLGVVIKPGRDWRFNIIASSGFRAPNVDDLSKVFESVKGNVILPNPNLKSENTYNLDFGLSKTFDKKLTVGGTAYYTWYKNAITTQFGTFNGQDSIVFEGVKSRVTMNVNALEAYIYGANVYMNATISDAFSVSSTLNYTYGRIRATTQNTPLDHIPPVFGKTSFNLLLDKFKGEFFVMYHGWKKVKDYNMAGEDNFATATPFGMPSWMTLNLRTSYAIHKNIQLQASLENILDQNYRVFASGVSAPGRNLVLTIRGSL